MNKQRGMSILGVIVFVVVIILVLSYFRISLKSVVESPSGQENINYVGGGLKSFWNDHLQKPASDLWNGIISNLNHVEEKSTPTINNKNEPAN